MLKLKLQYFGHLMRRVNSLEKTLIGAQEGIKHNVSLQEYLHIRIKLLAIKGCYQTSRTKTRQNKFYKISQKNQLRTKIKECFWE